MRFPNPVAVTCLSCGQPTVMAETALGAVRVHCGTWRWQCDIPDTSTRRGDESAMPSIGLIALAGAGDKELAA